MKTRLAVINDIVGILEMLQAMHAECGFYSMDDEKVCDAVTYAIDTSQCYVLVDNDGTLHGTIALEVYQPWWSLDWEIMDKWVFVKEKSRNHRNFTILIDAAVKRGADTHVPVLIGLHSKGATRKRQLFSRYMEEVFAAYDVKYIGGLFRPPTSPKSPPH